MAIDTINTALIFGQWLPPNQGAFSFWLFLKLGLVTVMDCVAIFNRFRLNPKMESVWGQSNRWLTVAAGLDQLLGAEVLVIVNIFSTMNPH